MTAMVVIFCLLTGAVAVLVFTRITRWYELLFLGGWGALLILVVTGMDMGEFGAALGRTVSGWFS